MKKILIAAGNYDIVSQVRQSLSGLPYEIYTAYSHYDTLFMLRQKPIDVVLVDSTMFDRKTGGKTLLALADLVASPPLIAYAQSDPLINSAQTIVAQTTTNARNAQIVYTSDLERPSLFKILAEVLHLPFPIVDTHEHNDLYDTSPKALLLWRDEEIQTLFSLSRSLTEVLDLTEVLQRVVMAARHLTDADEGILLMPDGETGQFYLRAEVGVDSEVAHTFRVKQQDSYAGQVFETGEPVLIGAGAPLKVKTQYFVNSLLYVPISLQNERIGVLGVNNRFKKSVFNSRHQELLTNLAAYAAIAIENARVHGQSVQRTKELKALVESGEAINSSLSMETTLLNISQQLVTLLNGGRLDIYQWKREVNSAKSKGNKTPQNEPMVLSRYFRSVWRVGYAPAISLKNRPLLQGALKNNVLLINLERREQTEEIAQLNKVGATALLAIPMMSEGQPLGLILAYYTKEMSKSPPEEAIQRAQAIGMEAITVLVHQHETMHNHAYRSADEVNTLLGSAWCEFALVGQDRRSLLVLISVGQATWLQHPYIDYDLAQFTDMLNLLRSQQAVKASANGDTSTLGSLSVLEAVNGRAVLGLPLINQGKSIGFVLFVDTERQRTFSEREIDLARAVVSQGATALQNAHLVHDLEMSFQELRTAQDRLVRGARLSAMGELAGAVAHQVNNPLTTIVLDAELLLMDSNMNTRARESLDAILRSGKRAASVVRRLLTMTSVRGDNAPYAEPVNVIDTVEETLSLIRAHVQREGVKVNHHIDVNVETPPTVMAMRDDLSDLWLNLLMNAHDALIGRSQAEMGVNVSYHENDDYITVTVWDNGVGIEDSIKDKIFEPFFTTKPMGEGTGLGLHICRQIIDRVGGSIDVEGNPQIGARFIVRLPVIRSEIG